MSEVLQTFTDVLKWWSIKDEKIGKAILMMNLLKIAYLRIAS